jgi:hypothetical protein
MTHDPIAELAGQIAALPHLPPAQRAARARSLVDHAKSVLSEVGDQAVAELAKSVGYGAAAAELEVSQSAINKAVTRHNARLKAQGSAP